MKGTSSQRKPTTKTSTPKRGPVPTFSPKAHALPTIPPYTSIKSGTKRGIPRRQAPPRSTISRVTTDAEFKEMMTLGKNGADDSSQLAKLFFDLSVDQRELTDVLMQVDYFHAMAPLHHYSAASVVKLYYASAQCCPDCQLYVLRIAVTMIELDNVPRQVELRKLIRFCEVLMKDTRPYQSFGNDQQRPRQELKEMHELFESKLKHSHKKGHGVQYTTEQLERIVNEQKRRTNNGEALMDDEEMEQFLRDGCPPKEDEPTEVAICSDDEYALSADEVEDRLFELEHPVDADNIDKFLSSQDDTVARRDKGSERFAMLSPEQQAKILDLAKLFTLWENAYSGCEVVWNVMKTDAEFDVDILISQIPVSFSDFLIQALMTFAENEGIAIPEMTPRM